MSYVAEYHESLQHVLGFFAVSGVPLDGEVEAEVVPSNIVDEHEVLVLRCGPNVSAPLPLPASVALGKADITSIGKHYQVKLRSNPFSSPSSSSQSDSQPEFLDAAHFQNMTPTSFICSSCSLPLAHVAQLSYRDLPSEHWAELVDAWMCHSDLKLHEHVKNGSKDGFWPGQGQVLVGGSYVLFREDVTVKGNLREAEVPAKVGIHFTSLFFFFYRANKKAGTGIPPMVICSGVRKPQVECVEAPAGLGIQDLGWKSFSAATGFVLWLIQNVQDQHLSVLNNSRVAEVYATGATCGDTSHISFQAKFA